MMTIKDFTKKWTQDDYVLVHPPSKEVEDLNISDSTKNWLIQAGIPTDAAPFLSFGKQGKKGWFPYVSKLYNLNSEYDIFRVIGHNGFGDPICIDETNNGMIVYLNHDDNFKKIFMNSDFPKLLECLLSYRGFIDYVITEIGEDAYLNGKVPEELKKQFVLQIKNIDEDVAKENSFWINEAFI